MNPTPQPTRKDNREIKKYLWIGGQFNDGDKFEFQAEPKGENKYNPSGIAIGTFNHNSYNGWEINPNFKEIKIKCKHEPIIETVTDLVPGGLYQHSVNGNVCSKCGELL